MIVSDFGDTYRLYGGFEVWEIESMDAFFKGNEILATIFHDFYKMPIQELAERRNEIPHSDFDIMENLLTLVGDKSFYLFTLYDQNHMELINLQARKIMNFGMDIEKIKKDCVYAMIMDKK